MMTTDSVQTKPDRTGSGFISGRCLKGFGEMLLFFFVLFGMALEAQAGFWEQTGGPEGGDIKSIITSPNYDSDQTVFSLVDGNIYKSTDGGETWLQVFDHFVQDVVISPDYSNDQTLFGLSQPPFGNTVIYKSMDGGITWTKVSNLAPFVSFSEVAISPQFSVDQTLFARGISGRTFYKSTDGGVMWIQNISFPQPNSFVGDFVFSPSYALDQTIFSTGRNKELLKSTDGGVSWSVIRTINSPINAPRVSIGLVILSPNFMTDQTVFAAVQDNRFFPTTNNIYKSIDGGTTWTQAIGLGNRSIRSLEFSPSYETDQTIFLANWNDVPYRSTDGGLTWAPIDTGLPNIPTSSSFAFSPAFQTDRTVFAGTGGAGIVKSIDGGITWTQKNTALKQAMNVTIAVSPGYQTDRTILAGTYPGVAKSTNGGDTWTSINTGLPSGSASQQVVLSPDYQSDQTAFAVIQEADFGTTSSMPRTIYKTVDGGQSWTPSNSGLPTSPFGFRCLTISPSYQMDQTVFVSGRGIFRSQDGGASWIKINTQGSCKMVISPSYATDQTIFSSDSGGGWKSIDGGFSFVSITDTLPSRGRFSGSGSFSFAISPSYETDQTLFVLRNICGAFIGCQLQLFKSTDGGLSWSSLKTFPRLIPTDDSNISTIAISPSYPSDKTLFGADLVGPGRNIWKSVDDGVTWERIPTPRHSIPSAWSPPLIRTTSMVFSPGYPCDGTIFFGTKTDSVWKYVDTEAMASCGPAPEIASFTSSAAAGDAVTITGTNFGTTQGSSTVTIGGAEATVTSWSDTQIVVTVPTGASDGPVVVTVNGIPVNAGQNFTLLQPGFTLSVTPNVETIASGGSAVYTLSLTSIDGFNQQVAFDTPLGLPAGATASYSPTALVPPGNATLTIQTSPTIPPGTYGLTVNANGGGAGDVKTVTLEVPVPTLTPPKDLAGVAGNQVVFLSWKPSPDTVDGYDILLCQEEACSTGVLLNFTPVTKTSFAVWHDNKGVPPQNGREYWFMVRARNGIVTTNASSPWSKQVKVIPQATSRHLPGFLIGRSPILFVHGICSNPNEKKAWIELTNALVNEGLKPGPTLNAQEVGNGLFQVVRDFHIGNADYEKQTPHLTDGGFTRPPDFYTLTFSSDSATYNSPGYYQGIDHQAQELSAILRFIRADRLSRGAPGAEVTLYAHSMGGLASRAYVQNPILYDAPNSVKIKHLITIGTPHQGVDLAGNVGLFAVIIRCDGNPPTVDARSGLSDMVPELGFLQALNNPGLPGAPVPSGQPSVYQDIPTAIRLTEIVGKGLVLTSGPGSNQVTFCSDGVVLCERQKFPIGRANLRSLETKAKHASGIPVDLLSPFKIPIPETEDIASFWCALSPTCLVIGTRSPVDIEIKGPLGEAIGKHQTSIWGAKYQEIVDPDGHIRDIVTIPFPETGDYQIRVIPDEIAAPTDVYALFETQGGVTKILGNNVQIQNTPVQPYAVVVDVTSPTITASVSPPPDAQGQHNTDVTVAFICSDDESSIASCTSPVTVTTEGAAQVVTGTAIDLAGNTATTSVTLNIDKTPPTMRGDLNGDGCIDRGDYRILITDIRNRLPNDPAHDLNGDGRVNVADARTLFRLFTNPRGAACP